MCVCVRMAVYHWTLAAAPIGPRLGSEPPEKRRRLDGHEGHGHEGHGHEGHGHEGHGHEGHGHGHGHTSTAFRHDSGVGTCSFVRLGAVGACQKTEKGTAFGQVLYLLVASGNVPRLRTWLVSGCLQLVAFLTHQTDMCSEAKAKPPKAGEATGATAIHSGEWGGGRGEGGCASA